MVLYCPSAWCAHCNTSRAICSIAQTCMQTNRRYVRTQNKHKFVTNHLFGVNVLTVHRNTSTLCLHVLYTHSKWFDLDRIARSEKKNQRWVKMVPDTFVNIEIVLARNRSMWIRVIKIERKVCVTFEMKSILFQLSQKFYRKVFKLQKWRNVLMKTHH